MITWAKPVRRLAALALLAVVVGAFYVLVAAPVLSRVTGTQREIEDNRLLLGRLQVAGRRDIDALTLERAVAELPVAAWLLKGETEAIQLAGLQTVVTSAAGAAGVRITGVRPIGASERHGLRLVGLKFDLRTDLATLQTVLHRIETGDPALVVGTLHVRGPGGSGLSTLPREALLDVTFGVYGIQPPRKG